MERIAPRASIENTLETVRTVSFEEKKNQTFAEDKINAFLDHILKLKQLLCEKAEAILEISEKLNGITWFNDIDDESLKLINDIISSAKDLHSSLIRQYIRLNVYQKKGIAKEEISLYKDSLDNLHESFTDLESVFFFLPEMEGFTETTKELSLV